MDIKNKVALITGAASGIGLETVKELLRNDAKGVIMADVNEAQGLIEEETLRNEFGNQRVIFIKTDVTNKDEFEDAFKKAIDTYKHLDIVINNAGILNEVNYKICLDVNLGGVTTGSFLGLEYMSKNTNGSGYGGVIINISSIAAICEKHRYTAPVYSATKAGILTLSKGLGHEFHTKKTGVKVIGVCPGGTITSFMCNMKFRNDGDIEIARLHEGKVLQTVDTIARSIIHLIRNGTSGTAWLVEDNNLYIIKDYDQLQNCTELIIEGI